MPANFNQSSMKVENTLRKLAGMEDTDISDPVTGKPIRVSTTTRKMFRYIHRNYPDLGYDKMKNVELNRIIAQNFADSADKVKHHFRLKSSTIETKEQDSGEIRNWSGTVMFFISAIRPGEIDILTLQSAWRPPRYRKEKVV